MNTNTNTNESGFWKLVSEILDDQTKQMEEFIRTLKGISHIIEVKAEDLKRNDKQHLN